ncbi:hypothetical protein FJT64_007461 [Amphibalanus amphitrite]|uniref:Uncharacterized protein n=1 Tax=Amphibalanus amphitrite TaxID=1232801 RepID=A0A6A4VTI3_AMPAM|nr:hypothetical protein FJT64_007461 [Amphibalanus amphitrite]
MNRTPYYTHVYRPPGHDSAAYPAASAAAAAAAASRLGTYSLPGGAFHAAWQAGLPYPVRPAAVSSEARVHDRAVPGRCPRGEGPWPLNGVSRPADWDLQSASVSPGRGSGAGLGVMRPPPGPRG